MLQGRNLKEMTDYDAAAALLMLSSGGQSSPPSAESNNNCTKTMAVRPSKHSGGPTNLTKPQSAATVFMVDLTTSPLSKLPASRSKLTQMSTEPKLVALRMEDLVRPKQRSLLRVQTEDDEMKKQPPQKAKPILKPVAGLAASPRHQHFERESKIAEPGAAGIRSAILLHDVGRLGSSSPPDVVHRWDSSRTSSPIVPGSSGLPSSPHSSHDGYQKLRGGSTKPRMYDSPGMNGFAQQLNNKEIGRSNYDAVSSPEPSPLAAPVVLEGERKSLRPYNPPASTASSNVEDKSLHSPADSGVSSMHDEILQSNLHVQMWTKGAHLGEGLPALVRSELRKIIVASASNKDLFTKSKMMQFPLEIRLNPNKSRFRKECYNDIDNLDREKNNAASRRSRHKRKLMTHMMGISLEFDRNENRQLYLQEEWLNNMIFELEEKALNDGMEAHVLRKLRENCGFQ